MKGGREPVRFREDNPEDLDRARAAVKQWREENPQGSADQMTADLCGEFRAGYDPVLRGLLFAVDRHGARDVTGITIWQGRS